MKSQTEQTNSKQLCFSGKSNFNYTADVYIINVAVVVFKQYLLFISMFAWSLSNQTVNTEKDQS